MRNHILRASLVIFLAAASYATVALGLTVTVKDSGHLDQLIAHLGTKQATLQIDREHLINENVVVPPNIRLRFIRGGSLNIAAGATVSIGGLVEGEQRQIFRGSGSVHFIDSSVKVTPQMFGAKGDGQTDDTLAVQKAIDSGDEVFFPDGTYLLGKITPGPNFLENRLLTLRSNISISGAGKTSILKLKDHLLDGVNDSTSNTNVMVGYDLVNVTITNIAFDLNGAKNLTPPGKIRNAYAIYVLGGHGLSIRNNFLSESAGRNMIVIQNHGEKKGFNAVVSGNTLRNGGYYIGSRSGSPVENVNNTDFSFMYVVWDDSIIEKNWIEEQDPDVSLQHPAGGIEVHASNTKAMGNTLIGTNPAFYLATSPGPKEKITVSDNEIRNSIRGIVFFLYDGNLTDINVIHNNIELTNSSIKTSDVCAGIIVPTGNLEVFDKPHANAGYVERVNITDNTIFNNFSNKKLYPCDGMVLHSLHTAKITNNNINGMTGTGIMFLGSPWGSQDVEIEIVPGLVESSDSRLGARYATCTC